MTRHSLYATRGQLPSWAAPRNTTTPWVWTIGLTHAFAQRRLACRYTRLGDCERAEEHRLMCFEKSAVSDPQHEWWVKETRRELEKLARRR